MISKRAKVELISSRIFTKTFVDERPETYAIKYFYTDIILLLQYSRKISDAAMS